VLGWKEREILGEAWGLKRSPKTTREVSLLFHPPHRSRDRRGVLVEGWGLSEPPLADGKKERGLLGLLGLRMSHDDEEISSFFPSTP
jgi:hypothetical protein